MKDINFKHIIITKFNQFFNFSSEENYCNKNNSKDWLKLRFELFEDYCFPSIISQNNQNFIWLVFFAHDTPDEFRSIIYRFQSKCKNFVPIFTKFGAFLLKPYLDVISNYVDPSVQFLATTRLDSDDALNIDFVETIRNSVFSCSDYFLDCQFGMQYDIYKGVLVKIRIKSNSFLTRVEEINGGAFRTVLELKSHKSAIKLHKLILVSKPDMWLQTIHGSNLLNKFAIKSNPFVSPSACWTKFGIDNRPDKSFFLNLCYYIRGFIYRIKSSF